MPRQVFRASINGSDVSVTVHRDGKDISVCTQVDYDSVHDRESHREAHIAALNECMDAISAELRPEAA